MFDFFFFWFVQFMCGLLFGVVGLLIFVMVVFEVMYCFEFLEVVQVVDGQVECLNVGGLYLQVVFIIVIG